MKALDLEVSSKGTVSEEFSEDEILQADVRRLLKETSDQNDEKYFTLRRHMVSESDNEAIDFNLSNYLSFKLYRGSEDSALDEWFKYEARLNLEATDTIDIQFDFSEPKKVSRGS